MNKKTLYTAVLLTCLLALSAINPVLADDWGSPLATDPSSDGINPGEDIQSVDARYYNEFVYFRYKMNEYLHDENYYEIVIDFDKNLSSGTQLTFSDIGADFIFFCGINKISPYIETMIYLSVIDGPTYQVYYNMTANNGTSINWTPDPSVDPYFDMLPLSNTSQGDMAFGVNWTWLCMKMALQGVLGDNSSMFLEFQAGTMTDWCPDRTGNATDYIAWDITAGTGGIPGFSMDFALLSLLTFLGATILLHRKRI
jgi:hypothetical protein